MAGPFFPTVSCNVKQRCGYHWWLSSAQGDLKLGPEMTD